MSEAEIKKAVRYRDGFRCCDCGLTEMTHIRKYGCSLSVHRKKPGVFGGDYTLENCVTLCEKCHQRRHKKEGSCRRAKEFSFPRAPVTTYVDSRLRDILVKDAMESGVTLTDALSQALAKAYERPDLAAVPRKRIGRPLGMKMNGKKKAKAKESAK